MWLFRSQLWLALLLGPVLSANLWQTIKLWIFPPVNIIPLTQQQCQDGGCYVTNVTFNNTSQTSENSSLAEQVESSSNDTQMAASNVPPLDLNLEEGEDISNKTNEQQPEAHAAEQSIESESDKIESNRKDTVMFNTELSTIKNNNRSKRDVATSSSYESSAENGTINDIVKPLRANLSIEISHNISDIEATTEVNDREDITKYQHIENNSKLIDTLNQKEANNTDIQIKVDMCELEEESNKYEKSLNVSDQSLEDKSFKEKLEVNSSLNTEGSPKRVIEDQDGREIIENNDTNIVGGTFNESDSKLFLESNNNKQTPGNISYKSGLLNETNELRVKDGTLESALNMTNVINCTLCEIQDVNKTIDADTEKYSQFKVKNDTPYEKRNTFLELAKSIPVKSNSSKERSSINQSNKKFLKDNYFGKENVTAIKEIGGNSKKSDGTTMEIKYNSIVNASSALNIHSNNSQESEWSTSSLSEINEDITNATDTNVGTAFSVGTTVTIAESNNNTTVEDNPRNVTSSNQELESSNYTWQEN